MYKKELDNLIAANKLPKSIMLYGECEYLTTLYTKKISLIFGKKEDILAFYFDEYDFKSAKNFLSQSSLFGGKNILLIKSEKAVPKKELNTLVQICNKNQNSFFIYHFFGEAAKAKELANAFSKKKSADFVRFFKPNLTESISLLSLRAKELGIQISPHALRHLFQIQNEELSLCISELEKFSSIDKKIEIKDIDELVYGLGNISMDDFITNFLNKKDIAKNLKQILQSTENGEIKIVNALENYMMQLFMFHSYIKIHGTFNAKDILGYNLPINLAEQRARLCIKYNTKTYMQIFSHLAKTELDLKKSSYIDKNSYLISALIKLQSFL
jgi:DNA polymerase-3 subunit delta